MGFSLITRRTSMDFKCQTNPLTHCVKPQGKHLTAGKIGTRMPRVKKLSQTDSAFRSNEYSSSQIINECSKQLGALTQTRNCTSQAFQELCLHWKKNLVKYAFPPVLRAWHLSLLLCPYTYTKTLGRHKILPSPRL